MSSTEDESGPPDDASNISTAADQSAKPEPSPEPPSPPDDASNIETRGRDQKTPKRKK